SRGRLQGPAHPVGSAPHAVGRPAPVSYRCRYAGPMALVGFAALPALLVVAGAVLALVVSPWWWILTGVGAALLIIAIVDYVQPKIGRASCRERVGGWGR